MSYSIAQSPYERILRQSNWTPTLNHTQDLSEVDTIHEACIFMSFSTRLAARKIMHCAGTSFTIEFMHASCASKPLMTYGRSIQQYRCHSTARYPQIYISNAHPT